MIGIICFWDRLATPYLAKYEKLLQENGKEYEVLFWNRTPQPGTPKVIEQDNMVTINIPCTGSFYKRVLTFFKWRTAAQKVIRQRKYSALIVLSTVPAVLLGGLLLRKYREKYLFDIRDYTFEGHKPLRKLVMGLVNGSALTAISSKGYMRWLEPCHKIMVNHNITVEQAAGYTAPQLRTKQPLHFAFVGNVRLDTQTEALMLQLKDRSDFWQDFYGRVLPTCNIEQFVKDRQIENLRLHGPFDVAQKPVFFKDIDLLNAVYANAEKEEDIPLGDSTPIPNRLYDCLVFYRPLVASKGTYLAELIDQYGLGCTVNGFSADAPGIIRAYADSFDPEAFMKNCDTLRQQVWEEEKQYIAAVSSILRQWR